VNPVNFAENKWMKKIFFFVLILSSITASSQSPDSVVAPYLQDKKIPFFKMMLTDSSLFYKSNLKKNRAAIIFFFSPDCEHCKQQTEELLKNIDAFKKTQVIMVSPLPMKMIKDFYNEMQIDKYPTIKMGKDALYFFARYFNTHFFPFIAVYNKKGDLIKGWDGGTTVKELLECLK
jgi:thiol-disulfide isomerase/thioredoxin